MKRAIWHKYPKFLLLLLTVIPAFIIFYNRDIPWIHDGILSLGLVGVVLAGALYSLSFGAATGTALLLIIGGEWNIVIAALLAGIGGMVSDLVILDVMRFGFKDEVRRLRREPVIRAIGARVPAALKPHVIAVLGAAIIASPLPDELGVSLLAFAERLRLWQFLLLTYVLNILGALLILAIGHAYV